MTRIVPSLGRAVCLASLIAVGLVSDARAYTPDAFEAVAAVFTEADGRDQPCYAFFHVSKLRSQVASYCSYTSLRDRDLPQGWDDAISRAGVPFEPLGPWKRWDSSFLLEDEGRPFVRTYRIGEERVLFVLENARREVRVVALVGDIPEDDDEGETSAEAREEPDAGDEGEAALPAPSLDEALDAFFNRLAGSSHSCEDFFETHRVPEGMQARCASTGLRAREFTDALDAVISDLGETWKPTTPWENPRVEMFDGKKGPVFYRRYSAGDGHALLVAEGKGKDIRLAAFGSPGFDDPPPQGRSDEDEAEAEEPAITPPGRRVRVPLEYPWLGRLFELTGRVRVRMHLDETGAVTSVTVLNSSNPGFGFEQEAAICVGKWRYNPATRDDEPVPFDMEMLLTFRR